MFGSVGSRLKSAACPSKIINYKKELLTTLFKRYLPRLSLSSSPSCSFFTSDATNSAIIRSSASHGSLGVVISVFFERKNKIVKIFLVDEIKTNLLLFL